MQGPTAAEDASLEASADLAALSREIRLRILEQSKRANIGHIGSALSVVELLAAVYGGFISDAAGPERDRFVMSKGHAALALYATLAETGRMEPSRLDSFCADGSELGGHPEASLDGVDFSTGSLGQGLSIATGAALAARMQGSQRKVIALLSDAELNEGSVWEAAMFAGHHKLANLIALLDANGQQALGYTQEVLEQEDVLKRWSSFGWDVHEVPGHDVDRLAQTLASLDLKAGKPHVLVARTTFGCGVSFMEGKIDWHYLPMSDEQFDRAVGEVGAGPESQL